MQILKLGGSAITKKDGYMMPDRRAIIALAGAISHVWEKGVRDIILVHGAGSFGHSLVIRHKIGEGVKNEEQRIACALTHWSCAKLSDLVVSILIKKKVPAISIPPSSIVRQKGGRICSFSDAIIFDCLSSGYLPVLHGDMVLDSKLGASVCSGDQIISHLGKKAERMIFATNVDGVLAGGKLVPKITRGNFSEVSKHLGCSGSPDVTGGMAGKIKEIMGVGKPAYVVNAGRADRVVSLLLGKKAVCTEIRL